MESYNLLSKRYQSLLLHYKNCNCDCPTNKECVIVYNTLLYLLEELKRNAESLGPETIAFLKEPQVPCSKCTTTSSKKNPSSI